MNGMYSMAKVTRFEELYYWQKARELVNIVYNLSNEGRFSKDYDLCRQICRAVGSSMHNIAEGFDAGSDAEFSRFLKIARRSASDVQSQLYLALDRNYITEVQLKETYQLATEAKKLTNSLILYLNKGS
jgi:four helix bundle protein